MMDTANYISELLQHARDPKAGTDRLKAAFPDTYLPLIAIICLQTEISQSRVDSEKAKLQLEAAQKQLDELSLQASKSQIPSSVTASQDNEPNPQFKHPTRTFDWADEMNDVAEAESKAKTTSSTTPTPNTVPTRLIDVSDWQPKVATTPSRTTNITTRSSLSAREFLDNYHCDTPKLLRIRLPDDFFDLDAPSQSLYYKLPWSNTAEKEFLPDGWGIDTATGRWNRPPSEWRFYPRYDKWYRQTVCRDMDDFGKCYKARCQDLHPTETRAGYLGVMDKLSESKKKAEDVQHT